jgi:hypothetical protein
LRFSGQTPLTKTLKMPSESPDDCTVSANAQPDGSGKVQVTLLGTTRP